VAKGRYANAKLPVLLVTSDADFDDYGIVTDLGMRVSPFYAMPRTDKYLLSLKQLSHRQLSGDQSSSMPMALSDKTDRKAGGQAPGGGRGGKPGGGGGRGGVPGGPGGGEGMKGGQGMDQQSAPGRGGSGADAMSLVMRGVSLAFVQAYASDNAQALDWLSLDAPRWLRPYGSLTIK